jgi:hypothetical protein
MMTGAKNNKKSVSRHGVIRASGLALVALAAATASGQPAESVIVDVGACVDIENEQERLQCYESRVNEIVRVREFERSQSAGEGAAAPSRPAAAASEPAPAARPQSAREAAAPAEAPEEQEELSRAERRALRRAERLQREAEEAVAAAQKQAESPAQITATVTAVREVEPNMLMITLDNGQVWRQNRAQRYLLREGAEVQLRASSWGPSYRLTDPNLGGFIQVERRR